MDTEKGFKIIAGVAGVAILVMVISTAFIQQEIEGLTPTQVFKDDYYTEDIVLTIDKGERNPKRFKRKLEEGETVLDFLKGVIEEEELIIETYESGAFVKSMEGKENGQEGKYWLYYVNGKMPEVAVDKKILTAGDKIDFKFLKPSF